MPRLEPSAARGAHPELHLACERLHAVAVAVDDHRNAGRDRAARQQTVHVEMARSPVDFHRGSGLCGGGEESIEVDIMHDGSLDFDDAQLDGFDIVLASLHDHCGHEPTRLTERYLRAIHHPLVKVITHPANRSPARFDGYDIDFDRLFAAAAETGTAMEIDGAPGHLDMDGALARRAIAMGVTVAIDSDCHRSDALGRQMRFGLGTARRGWVQAAHVLNTRTVDAVRDFVARKRARF